MSIKLAPFVLLPLLALGCRTPSRSSLQDDAVAGGLHCIFVAPVGKGETFEIWAAPTDGTQLTNVQMRHADSSFDTSSTAVAIGTVPAVDESALTVNGRGLRTYFKSLMQIDPNNYSCFALDGGADATGGSFLCLARVANGANTQAYLATNESGQKFAAELTVFATNCSMN